MLTGSSSGCFRVTIRELVLDDAYTSNGTRPPGAAALTLRGITGVTDVPHPPVRLVGL